MAAFNEEFRFGSARWAEPNEMRLLHRGSLYLGLDNEGRILRHPSDGPALMVAGSGAGKALTSIMYNACCYPGSMLVADFKGEIAAVSLAAQAAMGKYAYCVNPARLLPDFLPSHSTDPLDILKRDTLALVPDAKMIAEMLVPLSGSSNGKHFEETARLCLEALLVADVEKRGVGSLGNLYRIICAIEGDQDKFLSILEAMGASGFEHVRSTAGTMFYKYRDAPKEWSGIAGEMRKSLSFLDDPSFLHALESPSFSLSILCERPCNVYINIPAEYIGIWSPYLRLLVGVAMLYKQRNPQRPRVVFLLDECGQLGHAEFLLRAMTFGRGAGILCQAVFQDLGQIARHYGREGVQTFLGSAQVRQFFGVRDLETAEMVSKMLGHETLSFDPDLDQAAARRNKAHIVRELLAGADPFDAGLNYAQQARAAVDRRKMARFLMSADEILRMPEDRQILFVSGVSCPPIAAYRKPYFLHRELAGRCLPNPYFGGGAHARIMGRSRMKIARVITEPVPESFAEYPQYASGLWSYIEGYRPQLEKRQ
ncbi:MAG TPA: type IV secretory system conjugative DNA transfer family protein [Steroidobacter sp.]|uniref:type IV secretory system conjugative DNA transfer family protein n=1 Tax=Steroidobacter sp. TaxID=1978227 RepID=UPI002ED7AAF4